jgi:hypothetical protein
MVNSEILSKKNMVIICKYIRIPNVYIFLSS